MIIFCSHSHSLPKNENMYATRKTVHCMALVLFTQDRSTKASFRTILMLTSNPNTLKPFHDRSRRRHWGQEWGQEWPPKPWGLDSDTKATPSRCLSFILNLVGRLPSRFVGTCLPSTGAPGVSVCNFRVTVGRLWCSPKTGIKLWTQPTSSAASSSARVSRFCLLVCATLCIRFSKLTLNCVGTTRYLLSIHLYRGLGFRNCL